MKTELANLLLDKYGKKNPPALKAGDTVRVHQKIKEGDKERVQIFEGLIIAVKHGKGLDATFTVRKIATGGIGVERTYPLHSPMIVKVERLKTAEVHRSKLYYMRTRLGKSARFKGEARTPMMWDESGVVKESELEALAAETDAIVEEIPEEVEVTPEVVETSTEVVEEAPAADEVVEETPAEEVAEDEVKEETAE